MEEQIKELFASVLELPSEKITPETTPKDLEGWDSYKQMFLVAAFEEEFDISIDPEEIVEMYKNFDAFMKIILNKIKN